VDHKTDRAKFLDVYKWNYETDSFLFCPKSSSESYVLGRIAELKFVSMETLLDELDRREYLLTWMARKKIKSYDEVAGIVRKYYLNPNEVYNRARLEA